MSCSLDLKNGEVTFHAMELPKLMKDRMNDYRREKGQTWFKDNDIEVPYSTWDPKTRKNYLLFRGPNAVAEAVAFTMWFKGERPL